MKKEIQSPIKSKFNNQRLRLGEGAIIDDNAVLGYPPSRDCDHTLTIAPGAHIRSGTIIYGGSRIGCKLETGHNVVIREENTIGDYLRIWSNSVIDYGCNIGNNVKIHNNVYIAQFTLLEEDVFLSPGVVLANDLHPGCPDALDCMKGPCIKKGAQIGINSCVLPRVTIGEYSVIGAGSIVTKDVPAGVVAYGSPAKVICDIAEVTCTTCHRDKPYSHIIERS